MVYKEVGYIGILCVLVSCSVFFLVFDMDCVYFGFCSEDNVD